MNDCPLISVIVPVYMVEKYLPKCIDSIINQTYKKLEIILIDDGSADNCPFICDEYAKKDARIKVIHKQNGGLSSARNAGADIAIGDYISFVDSDDFIDKDMLSLLMDLIIKNNADIAECGIRLHYRDSILEESKDKTIVLDNLTATRAFLDRSIDIKGCVCGKLYNKKVTDKIRFPEGRLHEDAYFTYKALYYSTTYVKTENCKYNYIKDRFGSIMTANTTAKNMRDVIDAFEERNGFFKNKQEILFEKSKAYYFKTLLSYYADAKIKLSNEKDLIDLIESKLVSSEKDIKDNKYLGKWKFKYFMFRRCPQLLAFIAKIRG